MKIIIPGGSGQVGTLLARAFHEDGHDVVVLSRNLSTAPWRVARWDGRTVGEWAFEFENSDVVINLAGRSVNCRYNSQNRLAIKQSRVQSTIVVGQAIAQTQHPPRVWLQMSTATIYSHRYEAGQDEATGIIGGEEPGVPETWRFSIDVAKSWERAMNETKTPQTRQVKLRAAMVMSADEGGVFDTLLRLVRYGLGGKSGDGRQYISWIHAEDFIKAVYWLIDHELDSAVNLAAPNPLPNAEFMRVLREAWGIRIGLPASSWMLEAGALFLRTETELILKSRRVIPGKLLESGFTFHFPSWPEAARDLCQQWRGNKLHAA